MATLNIIKIGTVIRFSSVLPPPLRGGASFSTTQLITLPTLSLRRHFNPSYCTTADTTTVTTTSEAAAPPPEENKQNPNDAVKLLDIRVGQITKAYIHQDADSLYVEEVDIGEPEPRTICSGLVKYVPIEYLENRKVVVLANLKARNMRGVKSFGMLMAASDEAHENVELLVPPEGSLPGDRIWFGSVEDGEDLPAPATPNQIQKKKIWELVQPHLKTDDSRTAMLGEEVMRTTAGVVVSESLKNANIS
ncbi:hypothetical protein ACFE04_005201 [Oxalis oulophora]